MMGGQAMKGKCITVNKYGISIVMRCASCARCASNGRVRICLASRGAVSPSHLCSDWKMSDACEAAGKGDGNVKKVEYLRHALDRLTLEDAAAEAAARHRMPYKRTSVDEIRKEYEKENGDIYFL